VRVLGIDPGIRGGAAVVAVNNGAAPTLVDAIDIPVAGIGAKERVDVLALRDWIRQHQPDRAVIERAQAMPKQGASSGFKYGRATGALEAVLACCEIPMEIIEPTRWKKLHQLRGSEKEASRQRALQLFPAAHAVFARKMDHGRAEAALIALAADGGDEDSWATGKPGRAGNPGYTEKEHEMSNIEQRNNSNLLPVLNADRGTHGELIQFKDPPRQHLRQDGTAMPPDWRGLVINMAKVIQFWQGGRPDPSKDIVEQPGKEFPDVAALNDQIPKSQWELDDNGNPRAPWSVSYAVYLFDPNDAQIYTHINSTGGQREAYRTLRERIELMRAYRGETVAPVVTLGEKIFSKRFNKYRAEFVPVEWRRPPGEPAEPKRLEKSPSGGLIGEKVEPPTLSEELNDAVPWLG
jgi:crossover junction endodeoxyribonuclease RuvC